MTTSYRRLVLHPFVVLLMLVAMVFFTAGGLYLLFAA